MFYALDSDNNKIEATPKGRAICPGCDGEVIAKCGDIKIWHWAHAVSSKCDSWHESMTEWHKKWMNHFPLENREVMMQDEITGKKRVADVKLDNDVVLKFQYANLTHADFVRRNDFYKNVIWVMNSYNFCPGFKPIIGRKLRDYGRYTIDIVQYGYPEEIIHEIKEKILKYSHKIKRNTHDWNPLAFVIWSDTKMSKFESELKQFLDNLTQEYEDAYGFKAQEINIHWFPKISEEIELPKMRKKQIFEEFENANVFIDNVVDYPEHLFYWKKKSLVSKKTFLQKYTQNIADSLPSPIQ